MKMKYPSPGTIGKSTPTSWPSGPNPAVSNDPFSVEYLCMLEIFFTAKIVQQLIRTIAILRTGETDKVKTYPIQISWYQIRLIE